MYVCGRRQETDQDPVQIDGRKEGRVGRAQERKAKGKRLGKSFSRIVNAFYHQRVADWIPLKWVVGRRGVQSRYYWVVCVFWAGMVNWNFRLQLPEMESFRFSVFVFVILQMLFVLRGFFWEGKWGGDGVLRGQPHGGNRLCKSTALELLQKRSSCRIPCTSRSISLTISVSLSLYISLWFALWLINRFLNRSPGCHPLSSFSQPSPHPRF